MARAGREDASWAMRGQKVEPIAAAAAGPGKTDHEVPNGRRAEESEWEGERSRKLKCEWMSPFALAKIDADSGAHAQLRKRTLSCRGGIKWR